MLDSKPLHDEKNKKRSGGRMKCCCRLASDGQVLLGVSLLSSLCLHAQSMLHKAPSDHVPLFNRQHGTVKL